MKIAKRYSQNFIVLSLLLPIFLGASPSMAEQATMEQLAGDILETCNVKGGLVVHVGCGDGRLTAGLHANDGFLVQGLDTNAGNVERARKHIKSLGLYGSVAVDHLAGKNLPFIDNLVNLVVSEDLGGVPMSEVMRVLCPNGFAYIKKGGKWTKTLKARPKEIDDWTHYLHDSTNNAVAHDTVIGPPRRMQWIGSPRWSRHHDRMTSTSALVSAGGKVFYIFDEASRFSVLLDPKWSLIARDAFNGTILWKRPIDNWHTHLWPLKSGPAQLPRRLVAVDNRVYVTLGIDAPVSVLDAATGETIRTYPQTKGTEEILYSNGTILALADKQAEVSVPKDLKRIGGGYGAKFWDERPRELVAVRAETGDVLWSKKRTVLPGTLAALDGRVFFHNGERIECLDEKSGQRLWQSDPVARAKQILGFYLPILVVYDDVVLFSGGETAGLQTGSWYMTGKDTMTAFSAETGDVLWSAHHPPSGYRSAEDLLVVNGLVWTGETTSGRATGLFTGRDPHTGQIKVEFKPDVDIYWFHHRCYRGKATDNYLLMSRAGTEFLDVRTQEWTVNHWVRGTCLYGIMPANGMLYNAPHPCACYMEAKLNGFNALAPASEGPRVSEQAAKRAKLEKGPAYERSFSGTVGTDDWPTYRHDMARTGRTKAAVSATLKSAWQSQVGPRLTSPVVAGGKVFVASVDTHTVHALDAGSGKELWTFTAGGRVDSPPTIYKGRVLFGSADGYVYCLDASDGVAAWRFRAAPTDQRLMSFEQIESVWPVHGSVLVRDGTVYCVAGRSMFLDGGLHLYRIDAETGQMVSHTALNEQEEETGKDLHSFVSWLNMPPALPDILSSDGKLVYMRSQPFTLDAKRLPLEAMPAGANADAGAPPPVQYPKYAHIFSPTGFLDDSWWHRTYWIYGSTFYSGWSGYFTAGKAAPAGRILVFDDTTVYGFGRKPQYYRWITPIEHHLFASPRVASGEEEPVGARSIIRVEKSKTLDMAGKEVTVEALVRAEKASGVVLARGGGSQGYVLYFQGGRPRFATRIKGKATAVAAKAKALGKWVHLAGVLSSDKQMHLYVDGKLVASAKVDGLIPSDPQEAMEIGDDEGSSVGEYGGPLAFKGSIDQIAVYHRALSAAEIEKHAAAKITGAEDGLVLAYSFDKGAAADLSGNKNDGKIEGGKTVEGRFAKAIQFTGQSGAVKGFAVHHDWTSDLPLFARAMVLAERTLFVAGPPDVIDEPQVFKQIAEPQVKAQIAKQAAALNGDQGAMLMAISTDGGQRLAEYQLDGLPVFDGMAAAGGNLFISMTDGRVICMTKE